MGTKERKIAFVQAVQNAANALGAAYAQLWELSSMYTGRGWNPGGSDPITAEDIGELGITPAQLDQFLTDFTNAFVKLMSGQPIGQPLNGSAIVNAIRSDR